MLETAVILAGGFGTRLQSVVNDLPKPMAPVNGVPFLNYQLNYLKYYGIKKVILSLGYLANKISGHYGTFYNEMDLSYVLENDPLGTGGGIRLALSQCTDNECLVLNGDSFFDIDLKRYYQLHIQSESQISLALRKVDDPSRYGTIETNREHRVISFREKGSETQQGLINAGVYILNKELYLKNTPTEANFSIEKDFFEIFLSTLEINGFEFKGYFIDIGIPEDYKKAQHDFKGFAYR